MKQQFFTLWNDLKKAYVSFKPLTFIQKIPTFLTASRILGALLCLVIGLFGYEKACLITACIFASTDLFDGILARKFNAISEFGRQLDTIADKLFVLCVVIPLFNLVDNLIIKVLLAGILICELIIAYVNTKSKLEGKKPKTSYLGKVKTTLVSVSIVLAYTFLFYNIKIFLLSFLAITLVISLITCFSYYFKNKKLLVKI